MKSAPIPAQPANPVMVEVTRGPMVESTHRGAAAVCDASGALVACWGDVQHGFFPRSVVKPLQALPLVESGAADHFKVSAAELALASASHGGEPQHLAVLDGWLHRIGLSEADLECGAHPPFNAEAALALAKAGRPPEAGHNNCSGKHCGMLTTALHLGEPTAGYIDFSHPVQRRITAILCEMTGCLPEHTPHGTDGCGIPTFALPLAGLAGAMAKLADPGRLGQARGDAARRILAAMQAHPELVAGSGQLGTLVMRAVPDIIIKTGAEGMYIAILPTRGLGIALKIADGATRASEVAMLAILRHLKVFSAAEEEALRAHIAPVLHNAAGRAVGSLRAAPGWL